MSDRGSENYEKQILKIVSGVGSELVIERPFPRSTIELRNASPR